MKNRIMVSVVVPVYNEEVDLPRNVPILYAFLEENLDNYDWELVIADNGPSTDRTPQVARELARAHKRLKYICIPRPGRGSALKEVWAKSKSQMLAYMDIDLSSELRFFLQLMKALESGSDIAIGSRLKKGARVYGRTLMREIMSQGYNVLIKLLFWTSFADAQCGFKAIRRDVADKLLPVIKDNAWFFDSELLIVGEKAGFKIAEIPITWRDDPRSTVKVAKTAWGDIKGLLRIFWERPWGKMKNEK